MLRRSCMPVIRSSLVFSFSDEAANLLCMIGLANQTPDNVSLMTILLNFVDVNILAFIRIDVLDGNCLIVDNASNWLWHRGVISDELFEIVDRWRIPLIRDQNHICIRIHVPTLTSIPHSNKKKVSPWIRSSLISEVFIFFTKAGLEAFDRHTWH